ncbi:BRCA1-associated protein [Papilio machaon]|uniref:BRCA1-associated protein n=1 Tax=Papilio machaon TaxID=76193 RepID=A0A0N1PHU3_PAPMA|nr:BRCA1-associated protein [Papilio machaon]
MSVSLCVLRIEIDEDLPEMGDNASEAEAAKEQKKKDRGARDSKTITVETYASVLVGSNTDSGILPTSSRRSPPEDNVCNDDETINFFCGNPLVEVTKGVLHLYKENELKEAEEAKTLCLLSVPGALGAPDLLAFAAACQQDIAHVRVLRDGSLDHYMALLTDGTPPPSHTELPTCPVCLERMDESVAGVLSVQCAHAFHSECLVRWRDARCPVCRCAQTPEPRGVARCDQCHAGAAHLAEGEGEEEVEVGGREGLAEGLPDGVTAGALWICLICGHVGCGRYEGGHAAKHFLASNHTYALQLGSNRVWDYAGDNFVHRLVQNKTDGKLVAAEGAGGEEEACGGEKLDAAQLEFTYILTQQLDGQRAYYEDKIAKMESERSAECEALRARAAAAEAESAELRGQVALLTRDNKALDRRLQHLTAKMSTLQSELSEERGLAAALAGSQAQWQEQARIKEQAFMQEVADLKEQQRDVMFFVEARGQLEKSECATQEEIASASVSVAPAKPRRRRR